MAIRTVTLKIRVKTTAGKWCVFVPSNSAPVIALSEAPREGSYNDDQ